MSKITYFKRYLVIINRLKISEVSYEDLVDYLKRNHEEDLSFSKRTLQRYIANISELFGIEIKYNASSKKYGIIETDDSEFSLRLLESFEMFQALNMSQSLQNYIHLESRQPQGLEHFNILLNAIKEKRKIRIIHQKFMDDIKTTRIVEPYALKEAQNRWHLVAKDTKDDIIKTFGLDRLLKVEVFKEKYKIEQELDIKEIFKYHFGVAAPQDEVPGTIILSFHPEEGKYINSYPLHHTQKILINNDEELRIQLNMHIAHDFIMELLSKGNRVKVLAPKRLQNKLCNYYRSALEQY